ncbi:MAG: GNAT family N-acetyltransferase [Anaerolineae bacterium]|nr:GNAT family N-acetyltransferase [Anaerolineae bacterium]
MLVGQQINLRDWQLADLELLAVWMQPHHRWHELDGPYYPRPTAEETAALVVQRRAQIERGDWPDVRTTLAIIHDETLIGTASRYWQSEETHWLSVGIVIYDPAYWQRGIGYEALGLWSDYLFATMPVLARLDLRTWSGNVGMMRLAEKLGYREEACFRKARIVNGAYYDGMGYGVLREEWGARYPAGFMGNGFVQIDPA